LKRKHQGYGDTFFIDEVFAGGFAMGIESWDSTDEQWDLMFSLDVA